MLIKKLMKHGNSYVLIIDRPIMAMLDIEPDSELLVQVSGKSLIVSVADDDNESARSKNPVES